MVLPPLPPWTGLPYSEIVRELLAAKKTMQRVIALTEEDKPFRSEAYHIKNMIESLQHCVEHQEDQEDPDRELSEEEEEERT